MNHNYSLLNSLIYFRLVLDINDLTSFPLQNIKLRIKVFRGKFALKLRPDYSRLKRKFRLEIVLGSGHLYLSANKNQARILKIKIKCHWLY